MSEDQNRSYTDKFMLRLPDGMRERLKEEAAASGRSMNAEIVHRLANSLGEKEFNDFAIGLGEELDFDLMVAASYNKRSLHEEMIYRLKQSLKPEISLVNELENRAWEARKKYDDIMELFLQLTPEERRILEERAEVVRHDARKIFDSKYIGELVKLKPIGKSGRISLTVPSKRDLFPDPKDF